MFSELEVVQKQKGKLINIIRNVANTISRDKAVAQKKKTKMIKHRYHIDKVPKFVDQIRE